jgi:flavodoxin
MKTLVAYYSLTGKTKLVASAIAETLSGTLAEITETRPRRPGGLVYVTGSFSALANRASKIYPIDADLTQHGTVFIGSPIWASRPVPAINSFIYRTDFAGRSVVPFFTMGGDDAQKAIVNITAKIEKSHGKVTRSFSVTTHNVPDDEIMARAKEAAKEHSAHVG